MRIAVPTRRAGGKDQHAKMLHAVLLSAILPCTLKISRRETWNDELGAVQNAACDRCGYPPAEHEELRNAPSS